MKLYFTIYRINYTLLTNYYSVHSFLELQLGLRGKKFVFSTEIICEWCFKAYHIDNSAIVIIICYKNFRSVYIYIDTYQKHIVL